MNSDPLIRVVDDDPSVRDGLSYMLRMEGFEVRTFTCADDFLRGDMPSRPGAVILDVRMPGLSGTQLQEELIARGYPHPIIFLSGHGDIGMAVSAVKKGAVDFLQKPVNAEELIKVLRESLAKDSEAHLYDEKAEKLADSLTRRERQVISLLLDNLTNALIAERLGISVRTVENHREAAYRKLGVNSMDALLTLVGERRDMFRKS